MSGRGAGSRPAKVVFVLLTGEDTGASMRVAEKALEANYVIVFPTEKCTGASGMNVKAS